MANTIGGGGGGCGGGCGGGGGNSSSDSCRIKFNDAKNKITTLLQRYTVVIFS
jgi:hypothetical protein